MNHRILVIDDNPAIHDDIRKILLRPEPVSGALEGEEALLFGGPNEVAAPEPQDDYPPTCFEIDSALQGQQGVELLRQSLLAQRPYALAFVDVRMPPGWDGIETITRLWELYPELQIVICTAYSDYSWGDITRRFGHSDSMLILKKPFDALAVLQMAHAMIKKWCWAQQAKSQLLNLNQMVDDLQVANRRLTREMSERIQTEKQLRLSEERLRQAQKMEAIGQLAAGVAHDFNNLLTIIQGNVSLLLMQGELDDRIQLPLKDTLSASERAGNLTRQLLAFSRKQVIELKPVLLSRVFEQLGGLLQRLIGAQVQIEFRCPPGIPPLYADPCSIEQIIMNLAVNARDAMPQGGHLIFSAEAATVSADRVETNASACAGEFVCVTVKDTGCGMDDAIKARVFEPFFTTKPPGKGTGMGLATVYGIVKQHKGWIELDSAPGCGTTFRIYLPVSDKPIDAADIPKAEADPTRCNGDETILVVEDEQFVGHFVQTVLESNGYEVLLAREASQAFDLWSRHSKKISLLLTDMIMPGGVTGKELAQNLSRDKRDLKVIITSGYALDIFGDDSHREYSILQKPYQAQVLATTVRRCLDAQPPAIALAKDRARVAKF